MLGRIADLRYTQKDETKLGVPAYNLKHKLEFLLDAILPKMIGRRRREAPAPPDEPSESDDDDY